MLGKKRILSLISLTFLCLFSASCSNSIKNDTDNVDKNTVKDSISQKTLDFREEPSDTLLKDSLELTYPDGILFTPTKMNNTFVIGESSQEDSPDQKYLGILNIDTKEFKKLKDVERTSDIVSIIINYADSDFILFEEFDQVNLQSTYYLWDISSSTYQLLKHISDVVPVHYTQVTRDENDIYMNIYSGNIYQTYCYSISNKEMSLFESRNSANPVAVDDKIFYITIDNENLKTSLMCFDSENDTYQTLDNTTQGSEYYNGLYTNGKDVIVSKNISGETQLSMMDDNKVETSFFSSNWIETLEYQDNYISYIGEKRDEERIKPQYYLMDIENKIDYIYDDGIILLSERGILWVDFKKEESKIEKGQVFTNDNSVMKFYQFDLEGSQ